MAGTILPAQLQAEAALSLQYILRVSGSTLNLVTGLPPAVHGVAFSQLGAQPVEQEVLTEGTPQTPTEHAGPQAPFGTQVQV